MLATDKDVLLSNTDNQVARHRRMLVPDNKVHISNKELFLSYKKGSPRPCKGMLILDKAIIPPDKGGILMPHNKQCLGKARECWSEAKAFDC